MSLSTQARSERKIELRFKENEIAALYQQLKSDEEIAEALHLAVGHVRATRDGMGLPPLRSASGRLFTPDVDTKVVTLREDKGMSFRAIGESLGYLAMDVEVRYRILKRLEGKRGGDPYEAVIPCKLCNKPFPSTAGTSGFASPADPTCFRSWNAAHTTRTTPVATRHT